MPTRFVDMVSLQHNLKKFIIFMLINVRFSSQALLTVSRRVDGDILTVSSQPTCSRTSCDVFDAELISGALRSNCTCQCRGTILNPANTFYEKTSKCLEDKKITTENYCKMTAKDEKNAYSSLIALEVSRTPMQLTLQNIPTGFKNIKLSKWSFYQHGDWHDGIEDIFSVSITKPSLLTPKAAKLKISNQIPNILSGLLLKVSVKVMFGDAFHSDQCLMFKVLGTYKVVPTTSPPTTVLSTTQVPITTNLPGAKTDEIAKPGKPKPTTVSIHTSSSPTVPKKPNDAPSGSKERLFIAIGTGAVTLLIVVLLVCIGCFFFRRQKRRKEKKADVIQACTRPSLPRPPVEDPTSPPHNYEYVVYPALTNSLPPPYSNSAHNSMENAMYGRGPDNELIIRTPAVSMESLISKHTNNSTKSNHSTLPQDYTPLESTLASESNSIYQPLIRPHTLQHSIKSDSEKPDSSKYLLDKGDVDHEQSNDEDFSYEVQPRDDHNCDENKGSCDKHGVNGDGERPRMHLEPCNDQVPEYMELEKMAPYSTTV